MGSGAEAVTDVSSNSEEIEKAGLTSTGLDSRTISPTSGVRLAADNEGECFEDKEGKQELRGDS